MIKNYTRKPNTECSICKKPIYRRPSQIKTGRVCCSVSCYGISCRKENPCVMCGKPILASLHKKTCSRSCANTYRTGIRYKLGRQKKDKVKAQQSLKIRLLKDRGGVCERCSCNTYEILHIHHKNRDRGNNDMENLELICPNCHAKEHLLEKSWLKNFFVNGDPLI